MHPHPGRTTRLARALSVVAVLCLPVTAGGQQAVRAAALASPAATALAATSPADGGAPPGPAAWLYGSEIRRIPTRQREVALTCNAAWDEAGIQEVLRTLRRHRVPATFFLTGRFAENHHRAVRTIAAQCGIANHSYSHPYFTRLSPGDAEREVTAADRALREAAGSAPLPFFRFPYGETTPQGVAQVNSLGFADIEWTTDTKGYLGTAGGISVRKAVARVADVLGPGAIIQMHVGSADGSGEVLDAQALPQIIDLITGQGYTVVDLRTLLDPDRQPDSVPRPG
ncbi:polysaccharide deacetylase family protein [Streptomyces sp. NPDC026206]|uniref:polysaccharide deacetylase family protein n=1 Tax=Streptomyces sp. NPDC026206 TaxID=3157089 RepID=UPI00340D8249